jgi:hypothetical protein
MIQAQKHQPRRREPLGAGTETSVIPDSDKPGLGLPETSRRVVNQDTGPTGPGVLLDHAADDEPGPKRVDRFAWERAIRRTPTRELRPSTRALLFAAGTYADRDGSNVRPGVAELMRATGRSKAYVCRHVATALHDGWLVQVERGGWRGCIGRATTFALTIPPATIDLPVSGGRSHRCYGLPRLAGAATALGREQAAT